MKSTFSALLSRYTHRSISNKLLELLHFGNGVHHRGKGTIAGSKASTAPAESFGVAFAAIALSLSPLVPVLSPSVVVASPAAFAKHLHLLIHTSLAKATQCYSSSGERLRRLLHTTHHLLMFGFSELKKRRRKVGSTQDVYKSHTCWHT